MRAERQAGDLKRKGNAESDEEMDKGICDKCENGGCASSKGGRGNKQGQVGKGVI